MCEVDADETESAADGEDAVEEGVSVPANDGLAHAGILEMILIHFSQWYCYKSLEPFLREKIWLNYVLLYRMLSQSIFKLNT